MIPPPENASAKGARKSKSAKGQKEQTPIKVPESIRRTPSAAKVFLCFFDFGFFLRHRSVAVTLSSACASLLVVMLPKGKRPAPDTYGDSAADSGTACDCDRLKDASPQHAVAAVSPASRGGADHGPETHRWPSWLSTHYCRAQHVLTLSSLVPACLRGRTRCRYLIGLGMADGSRRDTASGSPPAG